MDVPDHAAVDLSVRLVQSDRRAAKYAGLVNAVLRRCAREGQPLIDEVKSKNLDVAPWLFARWSAHYGAEAAADIAHAIGQDPSLDISVKSDPSQWATRLHGETLPTGSVRAVLQGSVTMLPGFSEGQWWVQDAAAALPVRLFGDIRGKNIVDLCAAPGGKTAQLVHGGARVTAVDRSPARMARLRDNLVRLSLDAKLAVADGAQFALARIQASGAAADAERQYAEGASKTRDGELKEVRARIRDLSADLDKVVNSAHGAQMAHATRRMQLEQIAARVAEEFAIEPDDLVTEYGPDVPVPAAEEDQPAAPYDRAVQEKRAQAAQRQLDQLGKVNPLALEEFAALEERHAFLVAQLEDLRKTRRDLLTVIKEVDDRVLQVFSAAYADTAREFERVFSTLFPGGEGRLVLTEPDDMLATGLDFEARPPGKKVKRLSLLSGGERSLTAIAFLVAIFMARPSPFYVMDEVEAALDDTNLGRLLDIFTELRETSQLIVVTHQKRTMEIADSLYGISMRGDGVSHVVSQRLRERETA